MSKRTGPFNPYKQFNGAIIPNGLAAYPGISPTAKLVWSRLVYHAYKHGVAWPKQTTLASEVGLSKRQVQRAIKELESASFIVVQHPKQVKRFAHCACRYYFIKHPCLQSDEVDQNAADKQWQSHALRHLSGDENHGTHQVPDVSTAEWTDVSTLKERDKEERRDRVSAVANATSRRRVSSKRQNDPNHPRWLKYAKKLHTAVYAITHVNRTRHLPQWAKQLERLHRIDKVPRDRIKRVLDWYVSALPDADQYMPQGFCGKSFREKFAKIESAMHRKSRNGTQHGTERPGPVMPDPMKNGYCRTWRDANGEVVRVEDGLDKNGNPAKAAKRPRKRKGH